jgi:hypothetical protein
VFDGDEIISRRCEHEVTAMDVHLTSLRISWVYLVR